jgi:methionyl-tRNA formyltransferase
MRLVFAGTPAFAKAALLALHDAGHQMVAVLTQPDRLSGRGQKSQMSPVKEAAIDLGLTILQPESFRSGRQGAEEAYETLKHLKPDLMIVAAYGLILPKTILQLPVYGCINIHASLLPRWRGAAPIQRAIQAGDRQTGISLMQMEEGLDTGPVWSMHETPIHEDDNAGTLHDRLMALGASAIVEFLRSNHLFEKTPTAQPEAGVTYAHKLLKDDGLIDWNKPGPDVACHIRAFDPFPGAVAQIRHDVVKLGGARFLDDDASKAQSTFAPNQPGRIIKADRMGLHVQCATGAVEIKTVQRPGAKRLSYRDFLNGYPLVVGDQFESLKSIPIKPPG